MVFIFVVLTILALSSWNIYSCIVVHRARNWFEENNAPLQQRFYPYGYGVGPMQVHVHNSPQQNAPGTPQGFITDAPHFPNQLQSNNQSHAVYPKIIYPSAPTQGQPKSGYVNSGIS
uniref:Uncharacterized protein n=1 Tax=Panagrolaimus davidi TaxID=227884 RepID=A0A914QLJ1_9BILA